MAPWLVGIGASGAQGLDDVRELLAALPGELDAVLLVVLHRTAERPSYLRDVLGMRSTNPVAVARDGQLLERGCCYIGEPGEHLTVVAGPRARLVKDSGHRNRTIDLLFHSLVAAGAPRIMGVVLSGALDDGARGLKAINEAGGVVMTLSLDQASPGQMPSNAQKIDGPMDCLGSPAELAAHIVRCVEPTASRRTQVGAGS